MWNKFCQKTDEVKEYYNSSVEVRAVSSPQLPRLKSNLSRNHLLDSSPEHRHDIREVNWGWTGVRVVVATPVNVFSLKVC